VTGGAKENEASPAGRPTSHIAKALREPRHRGKDWIRDGKKEIRWGVPVEKTSIAAQPRRRGGGWGGGGGGGGGGKKKNDFAAKTARC